ncbi:hypothetical protein D7V91_02540 [bacterium 1xD42-67]|nr:hypothetical protein D7V91_02540 [bacterium 1xD42-67]
MEQKQTKIWISVLLLIWAFIVAAAGHYVMSYTPDLSFNMRWLLGSIFSTPPVIALVVISALWKKKA